MKALILFLIGISAVANAEDWGIMSFHTGSHRYNMRVMETRVFPAGIYLYPYVLREHCVAKNEVLNSLGLPVPSQLIDLLKDRKVNVTCVDGLTQDPAHSNGEITQVEFQVNSRYPLIINYNSGVVEVPHHFTLRALIDAQNHYAMGVKTFDKDGALLSEHMDYQALRADMPTVVEALNRGLVRIVINSGSISFINVTQ